MGGIPIPPTLVSIVLCSGLCVVGGGWWVMGRTKNRRWPHDDDDDDDAASSPLVLSWALSVRA